MNTILNKWAVCNAPIFLNNIIQYSFFGTLISIEKIKAIQLQVWSGPEVSRKLMFPDFMTPAQDGGKVVSLNAPAAFTPRKYTWFSFLLEAESTPGP
jgi:hypothetical protein